MQQEIKRGIQTILKECHEYTSDQIAITSIFLKEDVTNDAIKEATVLKQFHSIEDVDMEMVGEVAIERINEELQYVLKSLL